MKSLIIGKELGGQMVWATEIENYPGFKSISSFELVQRMREQVEACGVEIVSGEVKNIYVKNDEANGGIYFELETEEGSYETRTVIVAIGLAPRRLAIAGEVEFQGKGVSYCATCDGPFFRGKTVGVVGGGNSALDAAEVLSKLAGKVYLIHRSSQFKAFEELVNKVKETANIELVLDSEAKEVKGAQKLERIIVENIKSKQIREIEMDGLFIEIGRIAHTDIVAGLAERNEFNQIIIDAKCKTSQEGIFAAGDATNTEFKQISIAVGQGTIAALSAYQYLQLKKGGSQTVVPDRGHGG